jgi:oligoribonuclease (3'-5' exoribonuclease)
MADNINNENLEKYNDSLRESSNLAKLLSDNIVALYGSMAKVDMAGRSTLSGLKEIGKDIQKTIGLTDKLRAGKLKEKEVTLQIAKLQQDYNKYIEDTQNGINNINSLTQKQIN